MTESFLFTQPPPSFQISTEQLPTRAVVLLHGLGRSARSMRPIERLLRARAYEVLNLDYPSTSEDIPSLAADVGTRISAWRSNDRVHVVTHSLGALILRYAVAHGHLATSRVHRAVMLGPPNAGSELADHLPRVPLLGAFYRRVTGPAGLQIGTDPRAVPAQLPSVSFETGVIAGTRSYNPFFSAILRGPSDGKVRVDRAGVAGMRDFVTVAAWHPFIMRQRRVHELMLRFLESGSFT